MYTSKCSEFLFHHKNNINTCTFGLKSKENNENDMTSAVWAGTIFGPRLWPLSARRHSLTRSIASYELQGITYLNVFFFSTHYPFIPNSFVFTFYRMTFRTNRIRLKSDWEKNSLNVPTYCNTIFEKEFNVFWSFFDAFLFGLKEKYFHVNTRLTKLLISYVSFLYPIAFIQYYANI